MSAIESVLTETRVFHPSPEFATVLREPRETAEAVAKFLEMPLDVEAMTRQVDGTLYRQRKK